jgi:hypothetical protein
MKSLVLLMMLVTANSVLAAVPDVFKGEIVDKGDRKLLYNYKRSVEKLPSQTISKREYTDVDGNLVATETSVYEGDKVIKMELDQKQTGEKGNFEIKDGKINFTYTKDGKTKTDDEKLEPNNISSDEIAPYLVKNWDKLLKGDTIDIRFPVIARQETVGFKFFKDHDDDKNVYIKMKPTSIVIAAIVNPLLFKMEKDGEHRVLEVDGRVTPKKKVGDAWKDLDALFVLKY